MSTSPFPNRLKAFVDVPSPPCDQKDHLEVVYPAVRRTFRTFGGARLFAPSRSRQRYEQRMQPSTSSTLTVAREANQ